MIAVSAVFARPQAYADYELSAFGVADYDGFDACSNVDLNWADNEAYQFTLHIGSSASYDAYVFATDQYVDSEDFVDESFGGNDELVNYGTDWADVVFFAGHGGVNCASEFSWLEMGQFNGEGHARSKWGTRILSNLRLAAPIVMQIL